MSMQWFWIKSSLTRPPKLRLQDYTAADWIEEMTGEVSVYDAALAWANSQGWGTCTVKEVEIKKACIDPALEDRAVQIRMELRCCQPGSYCKSGRAFWETYLTFSCRRRSLRAFGDITPLAC